LRIVMTGTNGFIGSAFAARNVLDADIVTIGRSPPAVKHGDHLSVDLAAPGELDRAIASRRLPDKPDVVMHLAVSRLHRTFPDTALDMFQVNVAAIASLLDYARQGGARYFVLGSTGTVYHPFRKAVHSEEDTSRPESYFGLSKLAAEQFAGLYAPRCFGLFIPRFFTPYGPGQSDRLVDGLIRSVRGGKPVTIPLSGKGVTSAPIYLDDAVDILERAISERWTGTYNVAGEEIFALEEMAQIIGQALGKRPVIQRTAQASGAVLVPDIAKLKTLVDVRQFVPFAEGIRRTIG
jgi:nucleoside-diphosphate-sugar epimerase